MEGKGSGDASDAMFLVMKLMNDDGVVLPDGCEGFLLAFESPEKAAGFFGDGVKGVLIKEGR